MKAAEKDAPLPSAEDVLAHYRRAVGIGKRNAPQSQSASFEIETYGGKGAAEHMSVDLVMNGANQVRMTDHKGNSTIKFSRTVRMRGPGTIRDGTLWMAGSLKR